MDFDSYKLVNTSMPTYLSEILKAEETIVLIHQKVKPITGDNTIDNIAENCEESEINNSLDLTGNPLMVNLEGDDDCDLSMKISRPDNWTEQEARHYPMKIKMARALLNTLNLQPVQSGEGGEPVLAKSRYCICDGQDVKRTVVLGSNHESMTRTLVSVLGCMPRSEPEMSVESMIRRHEKNCGFKTMISSRVTATYALHGWILKSSKHYSISNSAYLEASWNSADYVPTSNYSDAHLMLQVIAGHKDSDFNTFWQHLSLLQTLIHVLSGTLRSEEIEISADPLDVDTIIENITTIFLQQCSKPILKRQNVDLVNIDACEQRDEDTMDKLWDLLLDCENTEALRNCWTKLFVEIAQNTFFNIKISEDNHTSIAKIVSDIKEGKLAVPTITTMEAVKFFVELGLEKLKNDYLHIINMFDNLHAEQILAKWSGFLVEEEKEINTRVTCALPMMVAARLSKMTIQRGGISLNVASLTKRLDYLANLHMVVEFAKLVQTCNFNEERFHYVTKTILKSYLLDNENNVGFENLEAGRLSEIKVKMSNLDQSFLKNSSLVSWNLKMASSVHHSNVTTIFHHSDKPIFPKCIYSKYDIPVTENDEKIYFVTQAVIYLN